ncbi:membrane protein insertion efficiency factor YidD [Citricoccus muralis]|uniref:membrane protein insertion efficiency factor YidD n=1 Tax=Citricoccus muralis TaxID=169134 RepID=UPI003D6A2CBD
MNAVVESPFLTQPNPREWGFVRAIPSTLLATLLKAYRLVISPLYGPVCKFFPSCSAYALEAVTVHGAVKGSLLGARRLCRCHPWQSGGIDPVPPGRRIWPNGHLPRIIELNHPVVPPDPSDED